jgi:hypothetical protein
MDGNAVDRLDVGKAFVCGRLDEFPEGTGFTQMYGIHLTITEACATCGIDAYAPMLHSLKERRRPWQEPHDLLIIEGSYPCEDFEHEAILASPLGRPILVCYRHGGRVPNVLEGNPAVRARIAYPNFMGLRLLLQDWLRSNVAPLPALGKTA